MAEYIEREAAKLRIFEYGVRHRDNSSISFACENLERQMNSIPAADVRPVKWIPVTERLPETHGEYMVAYHPCYWDSVRDEIKVGLDSFRGKTSWAKKKYQRVTHWMPLPEPPKEE